VAAIGGRGVIIDMHAHDGSGVDQPQRSLFGDHSSTSTAGMAVAAAHRYGCDVVLCEKNKERMQALQLRFGAGPIYVINHRHLPEMTLDAYTWAIILNDPNGPSEHGVDVMAELAHCRTMTTDFIVMINDGALARIEGLADNDPTDADKVNGAAIIGARASVSFYSWMRSPDAWRERLSKRFVAFSTYTTNGKGYRGRLLLLSNSLANLNREMFAW
jgi:hypothetical protein